MDVDYLIDTIFKKQEPLTVAAVQSSNIVWYIALTDIDHGQLRYVCKDDSLDIFELLRAAKAIPLLYNKKITLASSYGKTRYIDGEFGATLDTHVQQAVDAGATRILIIKNNARWSWTRKVLVRLYLFSLPACTRILINKDLESSATLDSILHSFPDITIKMYSPSVPMGDATNSPKILQQAFEKGESDALAMEEELRKLLTI